MAHGIIMNQNFIENVMGLTTSEAAETAYYTALPGQLWDIPGHKGMRWPVGRIPLFADPSLTEWSFAEWWRQGMLIGIRIFPLQEPLYYQNQKEVNP